MYIWLILLREAKFLHMMLNTVNNKYFYSCLKFKTLCSSWNLVNSSWKPMTGSTWFPSILVVSRIKTTTDKRAMKRKREMAKSKREFSLHLNSIDRDSLSSKQSGFHTRCVCDSTGVARMTTTIAPLRGLRMLGALFSGKNVKLPGVCHMWKSRSFARYAWAIGQHARLQTRCIFPPYHVQFCLMTHWREIAKMLDSNVPDVEIQTNLLRCDYIDRVKHICIPGLAISLPCLPFFFYWIFETLAR